MKKYLFFYLFIFSISLFSLNAKTESLSNQNQENYEKLCAEIAALSTRKFQPSDLLFAMAKTCSHIKDATLAKTKEEKAEAGYGIMTSILLMAAQAASKEERKIKDLEEAEEAEEKFCAILSKYIGNEDEARALVKAIKASGSS